MNFQNERFEQTYCLCSDDISIPKAISKAGLYNYIYISVRFDCVYTISCLHYKLSHLVMSVAYRRFVDRIPAGINYTGTFAVLFSYYK
jgi:hypothetical protein